MADDMGVRDVSRSIRCPVPSGRTTPSTIHKFVQKWVVQVIGSRKSLATGMLDTWSSCRIVPGENLSNLTALLGCQDGGLRSGAFT